MKTRVFLFFIFSFFHWFSFGQNKFTEDGLKVEKWVEKGFWNGERYKNFGTYKIVSIKDFDTIWALDRTSLNTKYKKTSALVFFSGSFEDKISVKDGIWQNVNFFGKIKETECWENGIQLWTKTFNKKGELTYHYYEDFVNDTTFFLNYVDQQLFEKAYYPPENKNEETHIYYPINNLSISNAEPNFYSNFGKKDTIQLKISCKQALSINEISSNSENIKFAYPFNVLPLNLATKDTLTLDLIITSNSSTFRNSETITIKTSEGNVPDYKIYCSLRVFHVDGRNIETLRELSLSKSRDKYLYISQMGSITDAIISKGKKEIRNIRIMEDTKINLRKLKVGEYSLGVYSCENGGGLKLIILK